MSETFERIAAAIAICGIRQHIVKLSKGDALALARAALEEMQDFDTSDFTFTEAEAIRRFLDGALGKVDA